MEQPRPGGTTFVIVVKTSRPGKYASSQRLQNLQDVVFLTPHLSPADLSPVLTMKRKLWKISMENQSFHEQMIAWSFKKHRFPKRFWPFFTRNCFGLDKYATCGLRVTLQHHSYHNVPIRLSVLTVVQLWSAEYVVYGRKMTLDNNLSWPINCPAQVARRLDL